MFDAAPSDSHPDDQDSQQDAPAAALPVSAETRSVEAPPETPAELKLLPFYPSREPPKREESAAKPAAPRPPRDWRRWRVAASVAAVVAIGGAAAAEHVHGLRVARAERAQTRVLARRLDSMTTRLESLEANRSRDELANMRKVLAEIKASAASTRDVGGAVTQLASRVEKLEKDQSARMDKLGDRLDHDAMARLADMTARLEKVEAKVGAPAVAAAAAAKPAPPAKAAEVAKAGPGVSYEPTGAIERPRPQLRGFRLAGIRNGYAMIDSPGGEFVVAPGDFVPGGGRVLRIERHGRDWVVVTTLGQIMAMN
jgi:hypothetical protein